MDKGWRQSSPIRGAPHILCTSTWRQFKCVLGPDEELQWPTNGQFSVLSFSQSDQFGIRSPTDPEGIEGIINLGGLEPRTSTRGALDTRRLLRLRYTPGDHDIPKIPLISATHLPILSLGGQ